MIKLFPVLVSVSLFIGCSEQKQSSAFYDRVRDFDADWHFQRDSVAGAEQTAFDDSKWRVLDLPHDWSIEDLADQIPEQRLDPFHRKVKEQTTVLQRDML
jgi:beta-galactosidase